MKTSSSNRGSGKGEGEPPVQGAGRPPEKKKPGFRVVDKRFSASADEPGAGEERRERVPTHVERLESLLEEKNRQLKEARAAIKKVEDEYEASRIRLRKESAREIEVGRRAVLVEILGVIDNFDRALKAAAGTSDFESLLQGVQLVRSQLLDTIAAFNVTRMDSLGRKFDPALHQVVTQVPVKSPDQDGVVAGVISEGYLMNDALLRPATVAVGKYEP